MMSIHCIVLCCALAHLLLAAVSFNGLFLLRIWTESRRFSKKEFPLFMDFSTFFDTFSHTNNAAYPPCVDHNPTLSIRVSLIIGVCVVVLTALRVRSSYMVVAEIIRGRTRRGTSGSGGFTIKTATSLSATPNPLHATGSGSGSSSPVRTLSTPTTTTAASAIVAAPTKARHPPVSSVEQLYKTLRDQLMDDVAQENAEQDDLDGDVADPDSSISSITSEATKASLAHAAPEWKKNMSVRDLLSLYRHYAEHVNTHAQSVLHNISELKLQAASSNGNNLNGGVVGLDDFESVHDEGELLINVYNDYIRKYLDEEVEDVLEAGKVAAVRSLTPGSTAGEPGLNGADGKVAGDSELRDVVNSSTDNGMGGSVAPKASFLLKVRLLSVLFAVGTLASIGSIAGTVHLFNPRVQGIEDEDFNVSRMT
jgi:hypothetical protein